MKQQNRFIKNMNEQLISFETAKLAKEKGFDWKCIYACDNEIELYTAPFKEPINHNNKCYSKDSCSRSTQSLLQLLLHVPIPGKGLQGAEYLTKCRLQRKSE